MMDNMAKINLLQQEVLINPNCQATGKPLDWRQTVMVLTRYLNGEIAYSAVITAKTWDAVVKDRWADFIIGVTKHGQTAEYIDGREL